MNRFIFVAMKILILRFSSIGDIVLTTPVIRCLRNKFPDAEIHYATKQAYYSILQHNPYVNQIHLLQSSVFDLIHELKKEKFDYVIDLHHNQRTLLIKWMLGVKSFSFDKLNLEKWLMTKLKVNRLPDKHIVDRYLETCRSLDVMNDGKGLDYFISEDDVVDIKKMPEAFQTGYVAWVIGAKQDTKKFPVDKIVRAVEYIKHPVVLLGGKDDENEGSEIFQKCERFNAPVYNAAGKFSLNQSASLIQQAQVVVTNDTGLMHVAAAYKKSTISIWGNTIPEFGMSPYQTQKTIVEVKDLACRPCSKLGYAQCPQKHFSCMLLVDEKLLGATVNAKFDGH